LGSGYLFGCLVFMLFIVFVGCAYGFSVWLCVEVWLCVGIICVV